MVATIYEKHGVAFNNVSAYVIVDKGERVATIAFKRGVTGMVRCFLHIIGLEMVDGHAGGGGYDKNSAAAYDAVTRIKVKDGARPDERDTLANFKQALEKGNGGSHWDSALRDMGYSVYQAV